MRIAGLHGRPDLKQALERRLSKEDGFVRVSASAVTSNVLVVFDSGRELPEVIGLIEVVLKSVDLSTPYHPPPEPPRVSFLSFLKALAKGSGRTRTNGQPATGGATPEQAAAPWHTLAADEAARFWRTPPEGLSDASASERLARYGPNVLPYAKPRSALSIFLDQFRSLPVLLLFGSAAISLATGGLADALVISVVVLLNASMGAVTELNAERTISSLINLSEPVAAVLREGTVRQITAAEVVPGDVLLLSRGSHIAADARLLEAEKLTVDESALTGEAVPVEKSAAAVPEARLALADRTAMVFRGTVASGGSGSAVVVATGAHTEIGRVQALIAESTQPETPLQRQLRVLGNQLVWFTGAVAGAVFGIGLLRGYSALEMLRSAISLAVAAVPEGLPTVATITLASGMSSLTRHEVLVRRLAAVETLGTVQVLCFDKTGTLTLNQMSVVAAFTGFRHYDVSGGTFFSNGKPVQPASLPEARRLLEICSLCSEAEVSIRNGSVEIDGSATESALVRMAILAGVDVSALRRRHPLRRTGYRARGRNYMTTLHAAGAGRQLMAVKGNPSEVLALATRYAKDSGIHSLTEAERRAIVAANERMAGGALRVLGVAYLDLDAGQPEMPHGLIWLGLVGIADPPREGLRDLIGAFRQAGVRPVMLTGDQRATARAVGQALHLNGGEHIEVLDSGLPGEFAAEELRARIPDISIFSRVSPAQKLQIVRAFQRAGSVVAMTGDGINDGPALKAADVGIALGQSGTRVAREVADVLLTDDNIHALVPAIREGRRVHENIRKSIHYVASTNLGEILLMLGAMGAGMGQPLNPRQLLWINLITDVFPELALALGPADTDLMRCPPADAQAPVLGRKEYGRVAREAGIMTGAAMAAYAWGVSRYGMGPRASTMGFLTLTAAQLLHGITVRAQSASVFSRRPLPPNPYLSMSIIGGFAALGLSQFGLNSLLGTERVGVADALVCAGASVASFLANEASKGVKT